MTRDEDEAQQVVADVVVERGFEIGRGELALDREIVAVFLVLAALQLVAAQPVERAVLRRRHQPGARIVRDARLGPALERDDERVLRELLGDADVAHHAREPRDQPGRLDAEHRLDRAMGIGSRHDSRSEQLLPRVSS